MTVVYQDGTTTRADYYNAAGLTRFIVVAGDNIVFVSEPRPEEPTRIRIRVTLVDADTLTVESVPIVSSATPIRARNGQSVTYHRKR